MEKKKARLAGRREVGNLSDRDKAAKSEAILRELDNLPELARARSIMAFSALCDEAELRPLWQRLIAAGKTVLFPLLVGDAGRMDAVQVTDVAKDLRPGKFGISQPRDGVPVDPRTIDLIFIPALAFDAEGNRVGRGGGYYDRFLAGRAPQAFRCGVAFECQVVRRLPVKEHDCHVHVLVTEKGLRRLRDGGKA